MNFELLFFVIFSAATLLSAVGVVLLQDPVRCALSLIVSFFSLACLYLLQSAELIAVLQILVYAGAIMVLFVFVIMLVEHHQEKLLREGLVPAAIAVVKVLAVLVVAFNMAAVILKSGIVAADKLPPQFGTARAIGREFFRTYLFQFELASVLLLAAVVGAVILSRREDGDAPPAKLTPALTGGEEHKH